MVSLASTFRRSPRPRATAARLLALAAVCAGTSAYAQLCSREMSATPLIPPAFYAMQDNPYTAEFEQLWVEPATGIQHRLLSREFVDKEGRQRFEFGSDECAGRASTPVRVQVFDVVARTVFTLDEVHRQCGVSALPPTRTAPIHVPPGGWPERSDPRPHDSGDRVRIAEAQQVAGLLALGTRTTFQRGAEQVVDELWVSPQFRIPLLRIHTDPRSGTVITRMARFTRGDPDEHLFQIPAAGYAPMPVP